MSVTNNPNQAWKTVNITCSQITCSNELAEPYNYNYFIRIGPNIANTIENRDANFMDYLTKTTKTKNVFKFQVISVAKVVGLLRSLIPYKSTGIHDKIPAKIICFKEFAI